MSPGAKTINGMLAAEAVTRMESDRISALVVTNEAGAVTGVIHLLALLRAGIASQNTQITLLLGRRRRDERGQGHLHQRWC